MKTIATFNKSEDAHLLKLQLEAVGFEVFIQDENAALSLTSNIAGGIRVQVADEDVQEVMEFLDAERQSDAQNLDPEVRECPECGSSNTGENPPPDNPGLLSLLVPNPSWLCKDCKHTWS
jgi:hypothetical protein